MVKYQAHLHQRSILRMQWWSTKLTCMKIDFANGEVLRWLGWKIDFPNSEVYGRLAFKINFANGEEHGLLAWKINYTNGKAHSPLAWKSISQIVKYRAHLHEKIDSENGKVHNPIARRIDFANGEIQGPLAWKSIPRMNKNSISRKVKYTPTSFLFQALKRRKKWAVCYTFIKTLLGWPYALLQP